MLPTTTTTTTKRCHRFLLTRDLKHIQKEETQQQRQQEAASSIAASLKSAPTSSQQSTTTTNVLFVHPKNAKVVKTALEDSGFLDKRYRMTKTNGGIIAVPITQECIAATRATNDGTNIDSWLNLVESIGTHSVPFSTAMMGRQKRK